MATLDLIGLRKTYANGVAAVKGVDLAVADGELVVLLGPSGCGKSTLLRMVAGLETATEGEIRIAGIRVNDMEPAERNIAMVFQNYALYPHMSVFGNMAYGLRNRKTPHAEIERRVGAAAAILGLDGLLERKPRHLSGGQRQRVAMGRAIVREPKVFLFDEPLSNLDAKLRGHMRVEIKRLQRRLATTSLYVTHDQVEAMTLADRLVVMNAGGVEQIGAPGDVYARPESQFVAEFIGSPPMNILPGVLSADGGAVQIAGGPMLPLAHPVARGGADVCVGIRPEHLQPAGGGAMAIVVDLIERLGADALLHGRLQNSSAALMIRVPSAAPFRVGETLALAAAPEHLHLFDTATGRRR